MVRDICIDVQENNTAKQASCYCPSSGVTFVVFVHILAPEFVSKQKLTNSVNYSPPAAMKLLVV